MFNIIMYTAEEADTFKDLLKFVLALTLHQMWSYKENFYALSISTELQLIMLTQFLEWDRTI